jgi:spore germination cell wall hydrolase CwlJ-like protein
MLRRPMPFNNNDRDAAIRTIIGEAGDQSADGQAAVAHVLFNRLKSGQFGGNMQDVVFSPGQFDAWQRQDRALAGINQRSTQYQQVGKIVDAVASGDIPDLTGGATYFLNPALTKNKPEWARGVGLNIGDHTFYSPDNPDYAKVPIRAALGVPLTSQFDPSAIIRQAIGSGASQ